MTGCAEDELVFHVPGLPRRAIVPGMAASVTVPSFSRSAVEEVCKVLAEAVTGSQIPNLIAPLLMTEKPGDEQLAKWKRLFNAVAIRQNEQKDGRPLIRLVPGVRTPVRLGSPAEFDTARARVNEKLLLSGFRVLEDGKLPRTQAARTISEAQQRADDLWAELARRDVHPDVLAFCRAVLMQQNYFHAVLEACKSGASGKPTKTETWLGRRAVDGVRGPEPARGRPLAGPCTWLRLRQLESPR